MATCVSRHWQSNNQNAITLYLKTAVKNHNTCGTRNFAFFSHLPNFDQPLQIPQLKVI